jgi:hypothetical protein
VLFTVGTKLPEASIWRLQAPIWPDIEAEYLSLEWIETQHSAAVNAPGIFAEDGLAALALLLMHNYCSGVNQESETA